MILRTGGDSRQHLVPVVLGGQKIFALDASGNPHLEQIGCSEKWLFVSIWEIMAGGSRFKFLPGFVFDRSSAPGPLAALKDRLGTAAPAVHDLLSRYGGRVPQDDGATTRATLDPWRAFARSEADAIYRDIVIQRGGGRALAWTAWAVLRTLGWAAWKS